VQHRALVGFGSVEGSGEASGGRLWTVSVRARLELRRILRAWKETGRLEAEVAELLDPALPDLDEVDAEAWIAAAVDDALPRARPVRSYTPWLAADGLLLTLGAFAMVATRGPLAVDLAADPNGPLAKDRAIWLCEVEPGVCW
jgi:hypothetical protein